jgi:3-methyl-2-oxobutanoate hydroxymethyltransferase
MSPAPAAAFRDRKARGEKIVVLTAYDAPTARLLAAAGVDILLVGDSVGVNILGLAHEREVTLDHMIHHIAAVRRGAPGAYVMGDLPYATYDTIAQGIDSAKALVAAGADCVKFEGAQPPLVAALKAEAIDVCCHLGLESQHQSEKRRQGKTAEAALRLYEDARALDAAGQDFLVLELTPRELAAKITRDIFAPTIGIGAGADCDGQVLVVNDMAGITQRAFKHNHRFGEIGAALTAAVSDYARDVRAGVFPAEAHGFSMAAQERDAFFAALDAKGK